MEEWKPMDSAPWDGPCVLLWRHRDKQHYVAKRVRGEHGPGWCTPDGYQIFSPDAWMPLPKPPVIQEEPQQHDDRPEWEMRTGFREEDFA